jgi:hypothetical protein
MGKGQGARGKGAKGQGARDQGEGRARGKAEKKIYRLSKAGVLLLISGGIVPEKEFRARFLENLNFLKKGLREGQGRDKVARRDEGGTRERQGERRGRSKGGRDETYKADKPRPNNQVGMVPSIWFPATSLLWVNGR